MEILLGVIFVVMFVLVVWDEQNEEKLERPYHGLSKGGKHT